MKCLKGASKTVKSYKNVGSVMFNYNTMCSNSSHLNYATKDSFSHNIILPLRGMFIVIPKRKTK